MPSLDPDELTAGPRRKPHLRHSCCPADGGDLWVFGYGSLMWHPGFPHVETRIGTLFGFHRRFCVRSVRYRGTLESPGLVLGLDQGGSCRGLVFRVPAGEVPAALDYLHDREMMSDVYTPGHRPVSTAQGEVQALSFVVDRSNMQYVGRLSLEATAEIISAAAGQRGPCSEYLTNTVRHLESLGLGAGNLRRLLALVDRRCAEGKG
jgi:cation transport protein ChaC